MQQITCVNKTCCMLHTIQIPVILAMVTGLGGWTILLAWSTGVYSSRLCESLWIASYTHDQNLSEIKSNYMTITGRDMSICA